MIDNLVLQMDAYQPLRNVVFQTLRSAILRGELQPGERLMELTLAAKLGVSRTPIREAIHMLENEGLAITIPRKGAEVAHMTVKDMEDVLQIRTALETLAAKTSCINITEEELARLKQCMEEFEQTDPDSDVVAIAQMDMVFHDVIYQASDNPKLLNMLNNLRAQMYRYRVEYLKVRENYPIIYADHRKIYEALAARDQEAVIKAVTEHLAKQSDVVKQVITEQNER